MKLLFITLFIYFIGIQLSLGQQELNLDFEKISVEGSARPWGWSYTGERTNVFSLDSIEVKSGKFSLKGYSEKSINNAQGIQFNLEPFALSGKTIRLNGKVQGQFSSGKSSVEIGYTTKTIHQEFIDTNEIVYEHDSIINKWELFDVSFSFPKNVITIFLKINFK